MKSEAMRVALIGGGPSALFMYKRLLESNANVQITIFEKSGRLGAGMPYSRCGSGAEHVTNVSSNEIPELPQSPHEWLINGGKTKGVAYSDYNPYKVFPRMLFGNYLESQFHALIASGRNQEIETAIKFNTNVTDLNYISEKVLVTTSKNRTYHFDKVVICTGHQFPMGLDEASTGYYHSPYPPQKLVLPLNHTVALRGASLTAVDAIKTMARANGIFKEKPNGTLVYKRNPESSKFRMVLHCRSGMLPAVRFHLQDSRLKNPSLLTPEQIERHKESNGGFLSLDYIFENDFMEPLKNTDPEFYEKVKHLTMEEFVHAMLELRERIDPFALLKAECHEADKSIRRKKSICWKEMLGVLSFALNYPAKYFSAEDMIRYKTTLHPLISLVIAYIPQPSCRELLALHKAGCLDMLHVGKESSVERLAGGGILYHYMNEKGRKATAQYDTYVDCTGQPQIDFKEFPFRGLVSQGIVTQARLAFRDFNAAKAYQEVHPTAVTTDREGKYHLKVSGIAVNDHFQVLEKSGKPNESTYMMAVPYMGGYNPDYSGLDFAEEASQRIADSMSRNATHPIQLKAVTAQVSSKRMVRVA